MRIDYLSERQLLPPAFTGCFRPIEEQAFALRHVLMKYALTGDDAILEQGINEMTSIMDSENQILSPWPKRWNIALLLNHPQLNRLEVISLEESTLYPLTHPQKRIWYVENIYPGTSIHNIGGLIKIYGPVDFQLLEESINLFVKHNDAIRIRLIERDEAVWQTVTAYRRRTFPFIDFTDRSSGTDVDAWVSAEFAKPLPLDGNLCMSLPS